MSHGTPDAALAGRAAVLTRIQEAEKRVEALLAEAKREAETRVQSVRSEARRTVEEARAEAARRRESILGEARRSLEAERKRILEEGGKRAGEFRRAAEERVPAAVERILARLEEEIRGLPPVGGGKAPSPSHLAALADPPLGQVRRPQARPPPPGSGE